MFESLYAGQAERGANAEPASRAVGQAPGKREPQDRYGDVPLGVESAWPVRNSQEQT